MRLDAAQHLCLPQQRAGRLLLHLHNRLRLRALKWDRCSLRHRCVLYRVHMLCFVALFASLCGNATIRFQSVWRLIIFVAVMLSATVLDLASFLFRLISSVSACHHVVPCFLHPLHVDVGS